MVTSSRSKCCEMQISRRSALLKIGSLAIGGITLPRLGRTSEVGKYAPGVPIANAVTVDEFYKGSDGNDWMPAFQRASNAIHRIGGGVMQLTQSEYFLGEYALSDVDGIVLGRQFNSQNVSRIWVLPSNVLVTSNQRTKINLGGGTSSPFGFTTSINVLSGLFDGELVTPVTQINQRLSKVQVQDIAGLRKGQTVRLARNARTKISTPSREDSPNQFLTISSVSESELTFTEQFRHRFDATEDLVVHFRAEGLDYPRNVWLENLYFCTPTATAYICHSGTINSGWHDITLDRGVSASWGTSSGVVSDRVFIYSDPVKQNTLTIESTSDVKWGTLLVEGNRSPNSLGGLLINDGSINVHFKHIEASNFERSGITILYGGDVTIDELILRNCATEALDKNTYAAALSVGFPAAGAGPSSSLLESLSEKYKIRNTGTLQLRIRKLQIFGQTTVPVRVHDADLTIDYAYIEFLNRESNSPILVGQSGYSRADSVFFPEGGKTIVKLRRIIVHPFGPPPVSVTAPNDPGSLFSASTPSKVLLENLTIDTERSSGKIY
jgi:hypothetical protein